MEKKKKVFIFIFLGIILSLIYIIFSAKPLTKEYQFSPIWKINVANPVVKNQNIKNEDRIYFRLGQVLGYFTENGEITHLKTFPSKSSISNHFYSIYSQNAKDTDFFDSNGNKKGNIEESGFPFFVDDLIYVFLPGGNSFVKCDENGKSVWRCENIFPITAFSAKSNFTAVGYADGNIKVFDNKNGEVQMDFKPGGSDFNVILGIDISEDGNTVASISGQKIQRFVLTKKEGNQQKVVFHKFLETETIYQSLVHFCKNDNRILYNYKNNLGIYDISTKQNSIIPLDKKIISIEESENFIYLLGKEKNDYTVSLIEQNNVLEGSFSFSAQTAFIHSKNNDLYVGKDNSISKLSVNKE